MASDRFVSRGGDKLQAALDQFKINVSGKIILDIGSSTGGFVDCLLQNGASRVYSVDTAYGELAWKLRQDPRVVVMERSNILQLKKLPEKVDLVTIDAGWTKLELIIPIVTRFLKPGGQIVALLKPHYQAEKKELKGGVLSEDQSEKVKAETLTHLRGVVAEMDSPILGGAGNREYLLLLQPDLVGGDL